MVIMIVLFQLYTTFCTQPNKHSVTLDSPEPVTVCMSEKVKLLCNTEMQTVSVTLSVELSDFYLLLYIAQKTFPNIIKHEKKTTAVPYQSSLIRLKALLPLVL